MSQCKALLSALKNAGNRGITTVQILRKTFIPNYTGRISDLRKEGHLIIKEPIKGKRYYRYYLLKGKHNGKRVNMARH